MRRWFVMLMLLGAAVPVSAQQPTPVTDTDAIANHLVPGDIVRLRIWREESMSGDYTVDVDGEVVLPRLGPWSVTARDPDAIRAELVEAYGRYLRTPSIEVTFLRRVAVSGAVQRPGVYHIDPTMTIRDALVQAGGATSVGRMDRIDLIRDGEVIQAQLRPDVQILQSPVRSGDELRVPERSWLSRNVNATVGIAGALLSFAAVLIVAGSN